MIDCRELPTAVRVHGPGLHAHILAPEKRPSPVTSGGQINIEFLHIHFSDFPRRQHICISTTSGINSTSTTTAPRPRQSLPHLRLHRAERIQPLPQCRGTSTTLHRYVCCEETNNCCSLAGQWRSFWHTLTVSLHRDIPPIARAG